MSANTETAGAPEGYVICGNQCGRYTLPEDDDWLCGSCSPRAKALPDWTPPIAAPAAHIERRKGQLWRYQYKNETPREYVLEQYHLGGTKDWPSSGWSLVGREWGWFDSAWSTESITMTLLADATPEPARLGKDAATLATENERLKGELEEARGLLREIRNCAGACYVCSVHGDAARIAGDAPPPAESTPVQPAKAHETNYGREAQLPSPNTDGRIGTKAGDTSDAEGKAKVAGESPAAPSIHVHGTDAQPAPPDDIRERLPVCVRCDGVGCEHCEPHDIHGASGWLTPPELSMRQDDQARHIRDHERRLAALEAKGEPGTHAFRCKDRHSKDMADCKTEGFDCVCDCGAKRNEHPKRAKP